MEASTVSEPNSLTALCANEMPQMRAPDLERIRNARNKRKAQIKEWQQYDRKMMRETEKLQRKGLGPSMERGFFRSRHAVKFPPSLIFLEAAARGDLDEVRKLLSNGVCPDVANEDGLTALHQCCIDNAPEMCRLLLRFGANPNACDTERWTPLHAAATCHHTELCGILISHGADLLAMNADGNMPYECCMPGPTLVLIETEMDKQGITQEKLDDLHRLPECEMLADMETLYKSGADFNILDQQGAAPLHIAAACGYEEVAIFLLKHGAKFDMPDRDGWQAIHIAACWDHLEIVELLVGYGADIIAKTASGETVFDICEDLDSHSRLMEIKEELERKQTQQLEGVSRSDKPRELVRRRSSTNPRSASVRRSSMRDKKMTSWKEAKQEAEMRGLLPLGLGDPEPSASNDGEQNGETVDGNTEHPTTSPLGVKPIKMKPAPTASSPPSRISSTKSPDPSSPPGSMSPKLRTVHTPPNSNANGSVRSASGATSPVIPGPPLRSQEKPSSKPSRTDKSLGHNDQATSGRQLVESNHRSNHRSLSVSKSKPQDQPHFIPIPQSRVVQLPPLSPDSYETGGQSPSFRARDSTSVDRSSLDRKSQLPTDARTVSPSPVKIRRSSGSISRKKVSEPLSSSKLEYVNPTLSVHNAYYNQSPIPPDAHLRSSLNRSQSVTRNPRTSINRQQTGDNRSTIHVTTSMSRRANKELIEYDSDPRSSGKCCILM